MTANDMREFRGFLRQCTAAQIQGVYDKEHAAGRHDYAALTIMEAEIRRITLDRREQDNEESNEDDDLAQPTGRLMQCTEGPYQIEDKDDFWVIGPTGKPVLVIFKSELATQQRTEEEFRANIGLMVAAPELLKFVLYVRDILVAHFDKALDPRETLSDLNHIFAEAKTCNGKTTAFSHIVDTGFVPIPVKLPTALEVHDSIIKCGRVVYAGQCVIKEGNTYVVYGPDFAGESFVVLDTALAVIRGRCIQEPE